MRAPSLTTLLGAALALFMLGLVSRKAADKPFTDAVAPTLRMPATPARRS
jgi:hypothetical protein